MTMNANSPDNTENAPLLEMAAKALGSGCQFEDRSREFGRRSINWRLTAADGSGFYLKRHEHRRHFETEVLTLREWAPKLAAADWWSSPSVVTADDELGAVILTELPGDQLDRTETTLAERQQMYRLAGKLDAMINALDVDASMAGQARTYDHEMVSFFIERAEPYLDSQTIRWIEEVCGAHDAYEGLSLVPTHSDYSPRNWLTHRVDGQLTLGLIDWERARPGYWLEDIQRIAQDHWLKEPSLREAFFDGYGRFPNEREERQLKLIVLMNATGTVSWAMEHNDHSFAALGRRTIEWLRDEL